MTQSRSIHDDYNTHPIGLLCMIIRGMIIYPQLSTKEQKLKAYWVFKKHKEWNSKLSKYTQTLFRIGNKDLIELKGYIHD